MYMHHSQQDYYQVQKNSMKCIVSLNTLISEHQNKDTSLLLICGDFNAKVGTNNDDAECVGRFSRGHGNVSGQCLIDFCNAHTLHNK